MSIALQRGGGGGCRRRPSCFPIYEPSPEGRRLGLQAEEEEEERSGSDASSSSIGRNSDCSAGGGEGLEEAEVQSTYKGPLDTMDALEETLPIRRGISNFYCGKSKSFTSLADAASTSCVKDIAKPENPYTRKRKNLFALSTMRDRARSHDNLLRSMQGIAKRPAKSSSRGAFTVAPSTSSSGSNSSSSEEEEHEPLRRRLPPLHPRSKPAVAVAVAQSPPSPNDGVPSPVRSRSLSLADLRGLASSPSASDWWSRG